MLYLSASSLLSSNLTRRTLALISSEIQDSPRNSHSIRDNLYQLVYSISGLVPVNQTSTEISLVSNWPVLYDNIKIALWQPVKNFKFLVQKFGIQNDVWYKGGG